MRISCILKASELDAAALYPDLILFPEGINENEVERACSSHVDTMIVGAVTEDGRNRGLLLHRGQNRIDYLKIGDDGRTAGGEEPEQLPVFESDDVCIGVVICMDIEIKLGRFSRTVIERIRSSESQFKLLCIPADMASHWFDGDNLSSGTFDGVNVALCNHTKTHQERCKSFVADVQ